MLSNCGCISKFSGEHFKSKNKYSRLLNKTAEGDCSVICFFRRPLQLTSCALKLRSTLKGIKLNFRDSYNWTVIPCSTHFTLKKVSVKSPKRVLKENIWGIKQTKTNIKYPLKKSLIWYRCRWLESESNSVRKRRNEKFLEAVMKSENGLQVYIKKEASYLNLYLTFNMTTWQVEMDLGLQKFSEIIFVTFNLD